MLTLKINLDLIEKIGTKYGASIEEVRLISEGFSIHDGYIILVSNLKELSGKFVNIQFDLIEEIIAQYHISYLLFEIEIKRRPGAETKRVVTSRIRKLKNLVEHIAFGNGIDSSSANETIFMMANADFENYSIHESLLDAKVKLMEISQRIQRRGN